MPLNEGAIRVTFAGGIETKTDPKVVPSGQLLTAENVVFRRATSLQKRYGYEALNATIDGQATPVVDGRRLAGRSDDGSTLSGEELLLFTAGRCYSRQTGVAQWADAGAVLSVVSTDRPLVRTGTHQVAPDFASIANVSVVAWEDGGVWWSVADESGRVLKAPTLVDAAAISPRCVAVGANLHVYYVVTGTVSVLVVNPAAPSAAVAPLVVVSDLDVASPTYDACATTRLGSPSVIAWSQAGGGLLGVGYVDQSGVLGSPISGHPSAVSILSNRQSGSPIAISFQFVDNGIFDWMAVAYVATANTGAISILSGGSGAANPIFEVDNREEYSGVSISRCAVTTTDGRVIYVLWEESAAASSERYVVPTTFDVDANVEAQLPAIRSVGLAARSFTVDGGSFGVFVHDTTFFNTYLVLRISNLAADGLISVARLAPANAGGAPSRAHLPSVSVVGDVARVALPYRERADTPGQNIFRETGIELFTLDFDNSQSHQTAQLGRGLYLAGACPQHYDGHTWNELGFHVGPELLVATPGSGGSLASSTTYQYVVWYEWADAQGEVHRGPTSVGVNVTMGASDTQVTLTLPTYRVTNKINVRICVARSLAAQTGNTSQRFRATSLDPATAGQPNGYVTSSTTVDSVTFIDRMSDATLGTQEELYTDGGVLSNDPAPLGSVMARSKNRLIATDPSDGTLYRYSQQISAGFAVEWPPDLVGSCDPFGGNITAIASQDDRIILFKECAIFVISGDGPTPSGDSSIAGFTLPQLVTSDVGCTQPNSIVLTPNGHMFQTTKGIYQLGRDGALSYIGSPVEAYNRQRIVRAQVMPDRTQVVFVTDAGSTLLYDYLFNQWSTFSNHEGLDAVVVDNTFHYLRTNGTVYRETIGSYSDAGLKIRMRIETSWLHMATWLQGFQRFWYAHILGTWVSPHQLGVSYQTDYTDGWSEPFWLDATSSTSSAGWITGGNAQEIGLEPIGGTSYGDGTYGSGPYGGAPPGIYQFRVDLNEKGESIRFRFEDFQSVASDGASFELTELLITGGMKGNAIRPFTKARST